MADNLNFKLYDPVSQLIASGGGGAGLPLTGGVLTGNLTLTAPAKIVQCQSPVDPCDLTNKAYVDGLLTTPGSIPGTSITNNSITNTQIATGTVTGGPGGNIAANTITSSELAAGAAADNINSGPDAAITGSKVQKAGNAQFGVVQFDPTGDLVESAANSGIAKIKQPAGPVQAATFNAAFDGSGNFIISTPARSGTFALPNNTPIVVSNIQIQVEEVGLNRAVQFALVNAGGGGTGTNASGLGLAASTVVSSTQNGIVPSTTFVTLSSPAWTDKEVEEWFLYVNDGIDNAFYRVTAYIFTPNSSVVIERLSTQ